MVESYTFWLDTYYTQGFPMRVFVFWYSSTHNWTEFSKYDMVHYTKSKLMHKGQGCYHCADNKVNLHVHNLSMLFFS